MNLQEEQHKCQKGNFIKTIVEHSCLSVIFYEVAPNLMLQQETNCILLKYYNEDIIKILEALQRAYDFHAFFGCNKYQFFTH